MALTWSLALLIIIIPLITAGDTCTRQKYAGVKTDEHYEKLLGIDTGYSHDQLRKSFAERQSPKWIVETAIDDVHGKLLCSYVFNCIHYMNLIKPLLDVEGKDAFKNPFNGNIIADLLFEREIHGMLNVLYNFGEIGSVHPLWTVYTYLFILCNFNPLPENRELNDQRRVRLLQEHEKVSTRLAQFTNLQCNNEDKNAYDDQNAGSVHHSTLAEIRAAPRITQNFIMTFVVEFRKTVRERMDKITTSMAIDDCKNYMKVGNLNLRPALAKPSDLKEFLENIAGVDKVERDGTYDQINRACTRNRELESFEAQTNGLLECHRRFMDVMKFALLRNLWIYVYEIAARLPSKNSEKQPILKDAIGWFFDKKWKTEESAIGGIENSIGLIFNDVNNILRLLGLKQDGQLNYIAETFQSPSYALALADLEQNKIVREDILALLKNFNSLNFPESYFTPAQFDNEYYKKKLATLAQKVKKYDQSKSMTLVSQSVFFLFGKYVETDLSEIDFDVIASFDRFSENMNLYSIASYHKIVIF